MIPYGRQTVSEADIEAVESVLRSDFLTQGEVVPSFERAVAKQVGARHAVAVNSATSALHMACAALGVGPGDRVWTSPNTFLATANCALYCGASVDFVDINRQTYNLCADLLAEKLVAAAKANSLPKVVIPVHFAGQPCEMPAIYQLSQRYGFRIIEDASHAVGAKYHDGAVGSCRYSDVTVFSFHPVKIITTAEGGMALTDCDKLAYKMELLRSHGMVRDRSRFIRPSDGPWYYEQQLLGFNFRMTEMQAALGLSQLHNLEAWVKRRHEIARRYDEALSDAPIITPIRDSSMRSALHLYPVQVQDRQRVFQAMRANGVGVNVHYIPVHTQPYYEKLGFRRGQFPHAEAYYERSLSLPIYPSMKDEQQAHVITSLRFAVAE